MHHAPYSCLILPHILPHLCFTLSHVLLHRVLYFVLVTTIHQGPSLFIIEPMLYSKLLILAYWGRLRPQTLCKFFEKEMSQIEKSKPKSKLQIEIPLPLSDQGNSLEFRNFLWQIDTAGLGIPTRNSYQSRWGILTMLRSNPDSSIPKTTTENSDTGISL